MTLAELEKECPPNISVTTAAKIMDVSAQFLRIALLEGRFPFGVGVKMGQNEFYINTLRFIRYMKCEGL